VRPRAAIEILRLHGAAPPSAAGFHGLVWSSSIARLWRGQVRHGDQPGSLQLRQAALDGNDAAKARQQQDDEHDSRRTIGWPDISAVTAKVETGHIALRGPNITTYADARRGVRTPSNDYYFYFADSRLI